MAFIAAAFNQYFTGFFHAHPADGAGVCFNTSLFSICPDNSGIKGDVSAVFRDRSCISLICISWVLNITDGAGVFPNEAAIICICRGYIYDYSAFIFVNTTLIRWICVACRIRDCSCIGISDQSAVRRRASMREMVFLFIGIDLLSLEMGEKLFLGQF